MAIYSMRNSKGGGNNRGQNYDPWPMTEKRERLLYADVGYIYLGELLYLYLYFLLHTIIHTYM